MDIKYYIYKYIIFIYVTYETLKSVVDSVNFMSSQIDNFNNQLKHLLSTINDLKCDRLLTAQNSNDCNCSTHIMKIKKCNK